MMKKLFYKHFVIVSFTVFGSICILLASCTKKEDTITTKSVKSKMELLTTYMFIYDSVINNWGTSSQTLIYARLSSNNSANWSNSRLKFYRDGSFDEILTTGVWRQGSWSMNTDSTILYTNGGGFSNTATLQTLIDEKMVWISGTLRGVQIAKK